jgi:hypothetical protein
MTRLTATTVYRSGQTVNRWNQETEKVKLNTDGNRLELTFCMRSKGGGITDVSVDVGPDDFYALCSEMIRADRNRALKEITSVIANEASKQSDVERMLRLEARESVFEAAENSYLAAPCGSDDVERSARDAVRDIIKNLNASDQGETSTKRALK